MSSDSSPSSSDHIDPLNPESHEPNPDPPSSDPSFSIYLPDGQHHRVTAQDLRSYSRVELPDCYVVSTGHGTSGPFVFSGVALLALIEHFLASSDNWQYVEVIGADGFGTRISRQELLCPSSARPIILADSRNGRPLTRKQGLVRLIVPGERDDALKQVKWVARVNVVDRKI